MKTALALVLAGGVLGFAADAQAGTIPATPHPQKAEGPISGTLAAVLIDGDDGWVWSNGGGSDSGDDNGDHSEGGDCPVETDDDCLDGTMGNAAPAGSVAPPRNGLFTNGTAPQVRSN